MNEHRDHNAPCIPLTILHNHCFQFLLGITVVPRQIQGNDYAKFWGSTRWIMECSPFVWKTRKFRGELNWNGSTRWKLSGKKVIPFEVLPLFLFYRNDRNFCLDYQCQALSRGKAESLPVFCKWYNSISFLFSVPKKIPVPFDGNFSPKFPYKW